MIPVAGETAIYLRPEPDHERSGEMFELFGRAVFGQLLPDLPEGASVIGVSCRRGNLEIGVHVESPEDVTAVLATMERSRLLHYQHAEPVGGDAPGLYKITAALFEE